jgi:hypothetical protein
MVFRKESTIRGLILACYVLATAARCDWCAVCAAADAPVEQWGVAEIKLTGHASGNPFVDVKLRGVFQLGDEKREAAGFYDGEGVYIVRFMPDRPGRWTYAIESNATDLAGAQGEIEVVPPSAKNHGPVRVHNTFHFAYADGTPYRELGTTCYAWTSQPRELEEQTLETLAAAPFNKLRMCVFPKRYTWNENEPPLYPFEGMPPEPAKYVPPPPGVSNPASVVRAPSSAHWDFTRFNPAFFRHLEERIADLRNLGIEADVILLHPYDEGHWGFDRMSDNADDRYLRYVVARLSAYRNVWWSMANEYDFMTEKQPEDWDRMIQVVADADPYDRLLSIHNGRLLYNHTNPLLTHASIQNGSAAEEAGRAVLYRDVYRKPIVFDEIKYEGDIPKRWGNLSAQEMVHRFWECIVAGTYPGHGETYQSPDDILWWSKGGVLKGQSPARIAFLRDILVTAPADGIEPIDKWQYPDIGGKAGAYYLVYLGHDAPRSWRFALPRHELADGMKFKVEVLDTWNMTIEPIADPYTLKRESEYLFVDKDGRNVDLPGRPGMALRITRVEKP